jgi:tetratricopeptide repeat protein
VRRTRAWFSVIGSAAALVATGCSSPTTSSNGTASSGWHWPWSQPAAATLGTQITNPDDATALANKPPKLRPDIYVATARIYEKNGDLAGAQAQYQKALKVDPTDMPALLGYAHLQDKREQYSEADKLYLEAIKQHPKDPSVYNDRGLSYQGRKKFDDASKMFAKAIELQPNKQLYRNNMAIVLVEMHREDDAFEQLAAANGPAIAHYNLATLLHRKGNDREAQFHFNLAAGLDPSLVAAHDWAARLGPGANRPATMTANAQPGPSRPSPDPMQVADRRSAPMQDSNRLDASRKVPNDPVVQTVPAEAIVGDERPKGHSIYVVPRPDANAPQEVFAPSPPTIVVPPTPSPAPTANFGVRYPEHAPASDTAQAAMPPSPERLNVLPKPSDALRPLPPVQ